MIDPAKFLQSWTEGNLPAFVDPGLRAGKARNLAQQCRADAEAVGIPETVLQVAAGGNLVAYFQDVMADSAPTGDASFHGRP